MTNTPKPQIRALQTKALVAALRGVPRWPEILAEVVRAMGDASSLEALGGLLDVSWVDLDLQDRLTVAIEQHLGERAHVELWQQVFHESIAGPMLTSMFGVVQRISGLEAVSLARRAPLVYRHMTRGCGELTWRDHSAGGTLQLLGLPTPHSLGCWARSTLGFLQAAASAIGQPTGVVALEMIDEPGRRATFEVRSARPVELDRSA